MIRHVVMWKLKDEADGRSKAENMLIMKQMLSDLSFEIEAVESLEVGINCGDEKYTNFDICLVATFKSIDDIEIYQNHPAHLRCVDFIRKVREERSAVDYPVED